eukprot:364237-Chlamydomonas_euryale.AAC.4
MQPRTEVCGRASNHGPGRAGVCTTADQACPPLSLPHIFLLDLTIHKHRHLQEERAFAPALAQKFVEAFAQAFVRAFVGETGSADAAPRLHAAHVLPRNGPPGRSSCMRPALNLAVSQFANLTILFCLPSFCHFCCVSPAAHSFPARAIPGRRAWPIPHHKLSPSRPANKPVDCFPDQPTDCTRDQPTDYTLQAAIASLDVQQLKAELSRSEDQAQRQAAEMLEERERQLAAARRELEEAVKGVEDELAVATREVRLRALVLVWA